MKKHNTLRYSGWYTSVSTWDSEGVSYVVMRYVKARNNEGEEAPEGAWFHKAGEDVGEAVVYY